MAQRAFSLSAAWLVVLASSLQPTLAAAGDATTAAGAPEPASAGTGTIEGVVRYRADPGRAWPLSRYYVQKAKEGLLAESVVALEDPALTASAPAYAAQSHTIDQVNFQFVPETLAIRKGDQVRILNSDDALHNVMTLDGGSPFNANVPKGQEFAHTFERAGGLNEPVRLTCVFHGGMRAWIYVFDHPWFQLTGRDGQFRLANVPAGSYRLGVVHPAGKLRWHRTVEVRPAGKTRVEITLSPDDLIGATVKAH